MPIRKTTNICCLLFFFLYLDSKQTIIAQEVQLSIKNALQKIESNLPVLESYRQQANAAQQNIYLSKNSSVPDLTAGYQVNIASYNNITGMSYPGFLLPISGPPSLSNDLNFVAGSAAGAIIKWNPFTFGRRPAAIEKAEAQFKQANAAYNEQLFQYQYAAVNSYLLALYYRQVVSRVEASIQRSKVELEQSLVLTRTGLKAGIDTTQFQSIIAQLEVDLLQAQRTYGQVMTELKWFTGIEVPTAKIFLSDTFFTAPLNLLQDTTMLSLHPTYQSAQAQKNTTAAALKEIEKAWTPQLDFWGNLYARGSGIEPSGAVHKWDGFGLSRTNAGIGLQLSFPVLQYSKVNIQKKQYQSLLKADDAKLSQIKLDISKQTETALMQYQQDLKIAEKTPLLLKTAGDVYQGLKLSYESGLIDFARLSQTQYELFKAEINDATARLQIWRSLLGVAIAKGDLHVFTDQLK